MNTSPEYWGRGSWAIRFVTIYKIKDIDELKFFLDNFYLPCQVCRENISKEKKEKNFENMKSSNDIRDFYVDIYNKHHEKNPISKTDLSNLDI